MGTKDVQSQSDNPVTSTAKEGSKWSTVKQHVTGTTTRRRKWFSLIKRTSEKKRIIQNILEKQEALSRKLTELTDDRQGILQQLASTNKYMADMTSKIHDLVSTVDTRKEYDNELKRQLREGKNEQVVQADEIRKSNKERHKFELEVCRLEAEVQKLQNDISHANKSKVNAEESLTEAKNNINKLKEERMDLHIEIQRQEGIIRELNVDIQLLKQNMSGLKSEINESERSIDSMREDRGKLLGHLRNKTQVFEDRLKMAWLQISCLKQEKDELQGPATKNNVASIGPIKLNNGTFQKMPRNFADVNMNKDIERQKTRVLQLELQLYRREKLVEILVDKVKQYDGSFSLMADSSLVAYLDENWSMATEPSEGLTMPSKVSSISTIDEEFASF